MRTIHSVKWILAGALIMPGLTGCSFFGGGDEAEVAAGEETAAAEGAEGAEANAQAEASDNAEAIGAENSTINDAAVASAAEAAAGPAGGGLPGSEIPPELLANGGTPSATDPTAGATAMGNSAPAGNFSAPPSDVRVYYVSSGTANLHQNPDASSQSVGAVKKGDPVLVKVEGNWANVINRGWVELASLSMSPVARPKPAKAWN